MNKKENLVRYISSDGGIVLYGIDSTDLVREAEKIHKTSAVITAALGRLLTAASLMGIGLKGEKDSVTVKINGNGPSGTLLAVSDAQGNVRGYAVNPIVEIPLSQKGKLDVGGAVGHTGTLTVIKDIGMKEPYVGQIELVSGEIAEDITSYYAVSEQIPTVCALGVLVNPDLTVNCAGGFLVQLLPGAKDEEIDKLEENLNGLPSVTQMLQQGFTPDTIAQRVLDGFAPQLLDRHVCSYHCPCSRKRVEQALISLGKEELNEMIEEGKDISVSCDFCNRVYSFTPQELKNLI